MTNEEIKEACAKFDDYLIANGVPVYGGVLLVDNPDETFGVFSRGPVDKLQAALIGIAADQLGYKMVLK